MYLYFVLNFSYKPHLSCNWNEFLGHIRRTPGEELLQKKLKKKKKKKGKLPKPYESGVLPEPNPDRWLPKHERPGYRKKKDRRNKDAGIGKGTQGAASGASDM